MSNQRELLSVVVPCYNEEESVGPTVEGIAKVVPSLPVNVDILLVDDGSTDGTRAVMNELAQRIPRCRVLASDTNQGAGRAALMAFEEIDSQSWVTCFPGDNEMVFDCIEGYLAVRGDYDLMLGYLQNSLIRPLGRRLASRAFTATAQVLYGYPYRYLNGVKMYRRWVFEGIEVESGGHAINAELIAKAMLKHPGLRVGEVPFVARGRARGHSKAIRPASVLRAVQETVRGFRSVERFRKNIIRGQG